MPAGELRDCVQRHDRGIGEWLIEAGEYFGNIVGDLAASITGSW